MTATADDATARVAAFLATDPRDVGCDEALALLPRWVELVTSGQDAGRRLPGVAVHLAACPPCAVDADGVLAAVRG